MTSKKMPLATAARTSARTACDAPLCRIVGYERVSTEDQVMDVQTQALKKLGCDIIFSEKVSAVSARRPQFHLMKKFVERGDTIAVYAFSRLSRNLKELLTFVDDMKAQGRQNRQHVRAAHRPIYHQRSHGPEHDWRN